MFAACGGAIQCFCGVLPTPPDPSFQPLSHTEDTEREGRNRGGSKWGPLKTWISLPMSYDVSYYYYYYDWSTRRRQEDREEEKANRILSAQAAAAKAAAARHVDGKQRGRTATVGHAKTGVLPRSLKSVKQVYAL